MLIGDIIRRAAQDTAWGNKTGLIFENTTLTFKQINERANRLANALLELGLKKGDRVGLLETNCAEYPIIYWAVSKAGGGYWSP